MDRQLRGDVLKKLACPRDEMNPALLGDKFLVVETGFRRVHTCCDQSGSKSKTKSSRHKSRWQKFTSDFSSVDSLQWTQTALQRSWSCSQNPQELSPASATKSSSHPQLSPPASHELSAAIRHREALVGPRPRRSTRSCPALQCLLGEDLLEQLVNHRATLGEEAIENANAAFHRIRENDPVASDPQP